ncbi:MAG: hypothetical protein D9C04_06435 [Nitrosopumilus sp. B06]|nr:MAG: hypothetical protein D9C04_06435 [Nitrosopumilus sp. B06]
MKKAYIDSNVLVGRFLPARDRPINPKLQRAKEILDKFDAGTHLRVISTFTLVELSGVCQSVEAYNTILLELMNPDQKANHILQEGRTKYREVLSQVLSLSHIKIVAM